MRYEQEVTFTTSSQLYTEKNRTIILFKKSDDRNFVYVTNQSIRDNVTFRNLLNTVLR